MVFQKGKGEFKTAIDIKVSGFQIKAEITPVQLIEKFDNDLYKAKKNKHNQILPLLVEVIL